MLITRRKALIGSAASLVARRSLLAAPALILPGRLRASQNLLAFPAGARPRFNRAHFAAQGLTKATGMCAVASANGMLNLLTGLPATVAGSPTTGGIYSQIGPAVNYAAGRHSFDTGGSGSNHNTITSAIMGVNLGSGFSILTANSDGTNGQEMVYNFGVAWSIGHRGGSGGSSGFLGSGLGGNITTNGAYFLAASTDSAQAAFAMTDLRSGKIYTAKVTGAISGGPAGDGVKSISNTSNPAVTAIAAAMWSQDNNFIPVEVLEQWALDPWAFWYERG